MRVAPGRSRRRVAVAVLRGAFAASVALFLIGTGLASAHEEREVAGYTIVIGMIGEPVYVGQKSGLEMTVTKGDAPVEGLEKSLQAEVILRDERRTLPLTPRFGEKGAYESVFFPTAAGAYTFHIFGMIESTSVEEQFTASPNGFGEVTEAASGQFPIQFPTAAELANDARAGAGASAQATLALALAAIALLAALVALGITLARGRTTRRTP